MTLPDCFMPSIETTITLERVMSGLTIQFEDGSLLVHAGLLGHHQGPSAGSDYYLTDDGFEALRRAQARDHGF